MQTAGGDVLIAGDRAAHYDGLRDNQVYRYENSRLWYGQSDDPQWYSPM